MLFRFAAFFLLGIAVAIPAELNYQKPAQEILDVLSAPPPPLISVSPSRDYAILMQPLRYPPIAEVARPMLRLAGLRIDIQTNGPHLPPYSTSYTNPTPQVRGIQKQIVKYQREDGVSLSFTLYLPPGYKQGTRLPTVLWAYPLEYNDANTAGQVTGSTGRFTVFTGPSLHLLFLLHGYCVLDEAAMPVIGDPETVNNTYVQQIVMDAKAAIDKAVEMGVADRERVGVGGHSYGAFMTANLLAHSDLFHAGVAESGAYNRTLTPFGFQTERRSLWEAQDIYLRMSPFMIADQIKTPILLIHGESDNNTGTFPIQSERLYQAIRGNGGTVRLVMLPLESHGYAGRESIEHVLWEEMNWFDKYLKKP
jgi:dipeptidyl aminopeptidase/acylaminoacyl peptidase